MSAVAVAAPARSRTGALLACGVVAGPIYITVAVLQMVIREGFDITRHPVSLLSNGDLGWIQIANFIVTGLLTIAFATGLGGTWAARLVGLCGGGVVAAGLFSADPMDGFPAGEPAVLSWHGMLHFAVGGIGFLALIAACLIMAHRHAAEGRRGWAAYSATTGVLFFAAFFGIASGSRIPGINVAFAVAVVLGWTWISLTAVRLRNQL